MEHVFTISVLLFCLPLGIGLWKWRWLDAPMRYAWWTILFAWLVGLTSIIMAWLKIQNHFLFYGVAIIGPIPYFLFYNSILGKGSWRVVILTGFVLVEIFTILDLSQRGILPYYSIPILLTDLILIGLAIQVMRMSQIRVPVRWVNGITFIYLLADFTYSLLTPTLFNYEQNQLLIMLTDGFTPFFNVLRIFGFSYAFWKVRDPRPPSFDTIPMFKSASP